MPKLFTPVKAQIEKIVQQTADTRTYTMRILDGDGKFYFKPGQFNMVSIMGFGEVPISISSDPFINDTIDHTIRAVGSITRHMESFKPGDVVGLRGPYGNSWPVDEARGKNVLVITGGIGLAPLRPLIMHMFHERDEFGKITILYGARTPADMLFTDEYDQWRQHPDTEVFLTVDKVPEGMEWKNTVGVVTALYDVAKLNPKNTLAVICGPEIMMRFASRGLVQRGFYAPQIYLSMERKMKCGVGKCGHCQLGPNFVCVDGPIFRYDEARELHDTLL